MTYSHCPLLKTGEACEREPARLADGVSQYPRRCLRSMCTVPNWLVHGGQAAEADRNGDRHRLSPHYCQGVSVAG